VNGWYVEEVAHCLSCKHACQRGGRQWSWFLIVLIRQDTHMKLFLPSSQPFTNCWKTIHGLCCIQCHRHQRSSTYLHGTLISLRRPSMGTRGAFRPICSTRPTSIPSCGPAMNQAEKQSTFASPRLYPPSNLSRSSLWTDKTNSSLSCPSLLCSSFVILYWLLYVRRCCIVQLLYKSLC